MRIVIDLQGAQNESRFRGIGRYTLSFAKAVANYAHCHEVILLLNGMFPETIEELRASLDGIVPQDRILVWHGIAPTKERDRSNAWRRQLSEQIMWEFVEHLAPDVFHSCSVFEGRGDNSITNIIERKSRFLKSVTLHDLVPLIHPTPYLGKRFDRDWYLRKLECFRRADVFLAISESSRREGLEHLGLSESSVINVGSDADPVFQNLHLSKEVASGALSKLGINRPFLMYTVGADYRKNIDGLIRAFSSLPMHLRSSHQLAIVGKMDSGERMRLDNFASNLGLSKNTVVTTGYVTDEDLVILYNLCKLFVFPSLHEGFGLPILEAMRCGAAVIGSNRTSIPEIIREEEALFDPHDVADMCAKIDRALVDLDFLGRLRKNSGTQAQRYSWERSARLAIFTWESALVRSPECHEVNQSVSKQHGLPAPHRAQRLSGIDSSSLSGVLNRISECEACHHLDLAAVASALARTFALRDSKRQLLLDVSEFVTRDAMTGIQRVVRNILLELTAEPPEDWVVELVYATREHGYRYARRFFAKFRGEDPTGHVDFPIDVSSGDVFFAMDLQHHVQIRHREFFRYMRNQGVRTWFMVHDLLPYHMPEYFGPGARELHSRWLEVVTEADGAVCVSRTVADELTEWLKNRSPQPTRPALITWNYNGVDLDLASKDDTRSGVNDETIEQLDEKLTFLMVATIEPRKGHQTVLDAFDRLWSEGEAFCLVLVGKVGWAVGDLVERIRRHPQLNRKLFWFEGISDASLERLYATSTCLITASHGEGFGLPILEAARRGLPIIARDIPVFREVARGGAFFFEGNTAEDISGSIRQWMQLFRAGTHPGPEAVVQVSRRESTKRLLGLMGVIEKGTEYVQIRS